MVKFFPPKFELIGMKIRFLKFEILMEITIKNAKFLYLVLVTPRHNILWNSEQTLHKWNLPKHNFAEDHILIRFLDNLLLMIPKSKSWGTTLHSCSRTQ